MTEFEVESKRSQSIFDILTTTSEKNTREVYINTYFNENDEIRFSIRLNEIKNRMNNLPFKTLVFVLLKFKLENNRPSKLKEINWFKMSAGFANTINAIVNILKNVSSENEQLNFREKVNKLEAEILLTQIRSIKWITV